MSGVLIVRTVYRVTPMVRMSNVGGVSGLFVIVPSMTN